MNSTASSIARLEEKLLKLIGTSWLSSVWIRSSRTPKLAIWATLARGDCLGEAPPPPPPPPSAADSRSE